MGIYDRDYYREDNRWSNPFARSQATLFLCLLYAFLYVGQIATRDNAPPWGPHRQDGITELFQLDVNKAVHGEVWRVFTYALVHDPWNFFHIIVTLVFLIWIGHQIEDIYGWKEYLAYFALTTLLGGIAYTAVASATGGNPILRGPSGAVTAVLVLFALHYPQRTISFFFFLPIPIWLFVIGYAFFDVAGLASGGANPAAVAVHLTGAAFAFVYHTYSLRVLNWLPSRGGSGRSVRRQPQPKFRAAREQPQPEPAAAATSAAGAGAKSGATSSVDEHLEAKLDQVLAKVAKSGKESLTESEREILLKASEVYKSRRKPG
jgi:rhomboid family protein